MPVPTVVSFSTGNATGAAFAVTAPVSITAGNLLVAFQSTDNLMSNPAAPTGWTLFNRTAWNSGSGDLVVWYKVATGSEPASYTFNNGGMTATSIACILNLSGAGAAPEQYGGNDTTGTVMPTGSVTTSFASELLLAGWSTTGLGITIDPSMTFELDGVTSNFWLDIGSLGAGSAGTYGPYTASNGSNSVGVGVLISIPPASSPPGHAVFKAIIVAPNVHPSILE